MMITLTVGPLEVNCYIIWDSSTREGFVIDPGGDAETIKEAVNKEKLKIKYIINTHGHFDHVGADGELKASLGALIAVHRKDSELLKDASEHAVIFGVKTPKQPAPDILLEGKEVFKAGTLSLEVIHTPGHTGGGVCLYAKKEGLLFTGDTLFAGSVGRTDLQGGSYEDLMNSIREKILTLGDAVKVLPGHGPSSTVGEERESNPFVTGGS